MATIIPRVSAPSVQVEQGPAIREQAPDFSAGIRLGQQVMGVAEQEFQRQVEINDTARLMQARSQLSQWESSTFDPGNPDGIAKYQGKNALGAREALDPKLQSTIADITKDMSARQKAKFMPIAANFSASFNERLNGYADREHSAYLRAEQKSAIDNLTQDAVAAGLAGDFGRQDSVGNELLAMVRADAQAHGYGEELVKAQERGLVSTIRASTIESMATTRPFEAQAYYERFADQMQPEDRARADRLLFPVVSDAHAQAMADTILAGGEPQQYRDPGQRGQPSSQVQTIIREEAEAAGVPVEYLLALAEQESGFNPNAVNPEVLDDGDNATGLFQYRATSAGGIDRKDARASAKRAAQEFAARSRKGGVEFAVAAHFAGEGGADAVVNRGRTSENPKTARYIGEVMGRAARWRGDAPAQPVAISGPPSEATAIERAQQIRDPRQRAAVLGKIRDAFQLSDLRKQEEDRAMTERSYVAIQNSANPNAPLREQLGAQGYEWAVRTGKLGTLEEMRKRKIAGQFTQDDPVLVDSLERQAALEPDKFAKVNLHALANRISTETLTSLINKQKEAGKPESQAQWSTEAERIDSGLRILGLDEASDFKNKDGGFSKPNDKKKQERKVMRAQFAQAYREAERAFVQTQKRKPTPEQADTLLRNVVKRIAGSSPEDMAKNLGRVGFIEGFGAALPAADRQEIIDTYRARYGQDPSEAQIVRIGARYRMQQNTNGDQ